MGCTVSRGLPIAGHTYVSIPRDNLIPCGFKWPDATPNEVVCDYRKQGTAEWHREALVKKDTFFKSVTNLHAGIYECRFFVDGTITPFPDTKKKNSPPSSDPDSPVNFTYFTLDASVKWNVTFMKDASVPASSTNHSTDAAMSMDKEASGESKDPLQLSPAQKSKLPPLENQPLPPSDPVTFELPKLNPIPHVEPEKSSEPSEAAITRNLASQNSSPSAGIQVYFKWTKPAPPASDNEVLKQVVFNVDGHNHTTTSGPQPEVLLNMLPGTHTVYVWIDGEKEEAGKLILSAKLTFQDTPSISTKSLTVKAS